jgi:hypothetical protein
MPDWQVFDRKSRPSVKQPLVSVQASGNFSLNEASYNAIGRPRFIEFLYDAGEQIVGMRAVDDKSPHAYPVTPQANGRTFQTGGRAFCHFHDIPTGKARRFAGELIDGVLAVRLKGEAREIKPGPVSDAKPKAKPKSKKGSAKNNGVIELRVASA